ncbi:hypothetical protein [Scleromatobacter humisilvae]|uniref:Uncharacterized protein n=1 Tax=Scleromatobacter humisilvae TaxID=2897159 RepID=A0A9X1YNP1_9BURK|nr:hypothetical protein [Scleromatobacter humisilvae]MCK9689157.1 hypothetical protein [Scleromatobacter humisilvae]
MMISPAGASDPYAAAAAFDRQLRSSSSDPGDAAPGSSLVAAGPDVVVTLGKGTPPGSSTYDASGRMSNGLTLDQLGANAPDSLAKASESDGDGGAASPSNADAASVDPATAGDVDQDATVAA